jgi:ABC-type protease/lipase transport system fused ATPase/permease subunit
VLVVSQRAAALERADQILLLNQGRVHQVDPGQALRGSKDALQSPTGR